MTEDNPPVPTIPTPPTLIEQADSVAKRIEEGNRKFEEMLKRQEEVLARSMLAGRSEAGSAVRQESPEEKVKREVNEKLKNIGMKPLP